MIDYDLGNVKVVSEAVSETLSRSEVKTYLRVPSSFTEEDTLIDNLIVAAREFAERATNLVLKEKVISIFFDTYPEDGVFYFPVAPVSSMISGTVTDQDGDATSFDFDSDYILDTSRIRNRLFLRGDSYYPSVTPQIANGIQFNFNAGYDSDSIPEMLKIAMLMYIGHLYEHRENVQTGYTVTQEIPFTTSQILNMYRVY